MVGLKLIALDLDGTVLRNDLSVSDRVRQAIARVSAAGHVVVLVTARHWLSVRAIAADVGVDGVLICSNGAVTYDQVTSSVRRADHLDRNAARAFITQVRAEIPGIGIGWETEHGGNRDAIFHALSSPTPTPYSGLVQLLDEIPDDHNVTKLLIGHGTLECAEVIERLPVKAHNLRAWNSGGWFAEVTSPAVSKANALAALSDELGIAQFDVIAIGDQPVDIPMLEWAGRGIAMANAHPAVLALVTERTESNDNDGVAVVLEGLLA